MLTAVTSLTKLCLTSCVEGTGCVAVCEGIANSSSLRELDLLHRNLKEGIHNQANDAIAKALAPNTCSNRIKILNEFGLEQGPARGRVVDVGIAGASSAGITHALSDVRQRDSVENKGMVDAQHHAQVQGKRTRMPEALPTSDSTLTKHRKIDERIRGGGGSAATKTGREGLEGEGAVERGEEAGAAAGSCVNMEEYNGSYKYVICSQSVRGDAAVLRCSQCSSNHFHRSCVEKTDFTHKCLQCSGNTVVPWRCSEACAAIATSAVPPIIDLMAHPYDETHAAGTAEMARIQTCIEHAMKEQDEVMEERRAAKEHGQVTAKVYVSLLLCLCLFSLCLSLCLYL